MRGSAFRRHTLGTAVFVAMCVAIFLVLLRIAGGLSTGESYHFEAVVPTAGQLAPHADVREAGIKVGTVTAISNRGASAVIAVALNQGPIYRDARVRVRIKTLVGEGYFDLQRGTPTAGQVPDRGTLPVSQASESVQLDEILSTFSPARRKRLQRLLTGLAGGVGGAGGNDLNATLGGISDTIRTGAPVLDALGAQRQQIATLVPNLTKIFNTLGQQREAIHTLATSGLAAATAVAAEATPIRQALPILPLALAQARHTSAHLASVGTHAIPVLDDLGTAMTLLTPAARQLPSAAHVTLRALKRLHAVAPQTDELLQALRNATPPLTATAPYLATLLRDVRPALGYVAPYGKDLGSMLANLGAFADLSDATSHLARPKATFTDALTTTLPDPTRKLLKLIIGLGIGQATDNLQLPGVELANTKGANGYPQPGTAGTPLAPSSPYQLIARDPPANVRSRR